MAYENVLTALADPTRRSVFEAVSKRPMSVGDLAKELPVSRPAVSQHLKVLQSANLVQFTEQGRRNIYSTTPTGLRELRDYIEGHWQDVLEAFASGVQQVKEEQHD